MSDEIEMERLVYSVDEFATAVGISRNSAFKAVRNNEIPYRRIGRRIVIPKQALLDFLSEDAAA
jgi:excisionase family DNA binding protein